MSKIKAGQAFDLIVASQLEAKVGDYKWSHLDEAAFAEEHLGTWFLCDGRSCIGTNFATITGQSTVPNAKAEGTFIRQAKDGRITGSYEADQMQGHTHAFSTSGNMKGNDGNGTPISTPRTSGGASNAPIITSDGTNGTPRTGNETRPVNIAVNVFIKVGY